jgi:hypothetical protein
MKEKKIISFSDFIKEDFGRDKKYYTNKRIKYFENNEWKEGQMVSSFLTPEGILINFSSGDTIVYPSTPAKELNGSDLKFDGEPEYKYSFR